LVLVQTLLLLERLCLQLQHGRISKPLAFPRPFPAFYFV
jgi:hypothetical protein